MKLKRKVKTLDGVPEKYHALYEKKGDEYVLDAAVPAVDDEPGDGDDDTKTKLDEFRANNRKLKKEKEALEAKLAKLNEVGLDVDDEDALAELLDARKTIDGLEEKELLKKGAKGIEELVNKRVEAYKAATDKKLQKLETDLRDRDQKISVLVQQRNQNLIETAASKAVAKVGNPRQGALTDILNRARMAMTVSEEGDVVLSDEVELTDADGKPIADVDGWAKHLFNSSGYLFESGTGAGAAGGRKGDSRNVKVIDGNDPQAFGQNLEGIAKGQVAVR